MSMLPVKQEIILGDCLDRTLGMPSLADKSVDHVLTDPPFSERVHRRLGKEGRSDGGRARGGLAFDPLTPELAWSCAREFARVARRWILIFCDELSFGLWVQVIEDVGAEYVRKGTWVKKDAMPQMSGDRPSTGTEEIVIAHAPRESGRMRWNGGGRTAVYGGLAQEPLIKRVHPAQKPLWLLGKLLNDFTDPGDTVIDPFAGSGSTLVAARQTGRGAIGWERDATTHAVAVRRVDEAREQLSLLQGANQ